jgi:hypothetical protein
VNNPWGAFPLRSCISYVFLFFALCWFVKAIVLIQYFTDRMFISSYFSVRPYVLGRWMTYRSINAETFMNLFFYIPFMVFGFWIGDVMLGAAFVVFFFCELLYVRIMKSATLGWVGAMRIIGDPDGEEKSKEGS